MGCLCSGGGKKGNDDDAGGAAAGDHGGDRKPSHKSSVGGAGARGGSVSGGSGGGVIAVGTLEALQSLLHREENKLIVVDCYADWCGPCKQIAPKLEHMAKVTYPNVVFVKVNVDENTEAAEFLEVTAMPTFKFFKGGKQVDSVVGAKESAITSLIDKHIPNNQRE